MKIGDKIATRKAFGEELVKIGSERDDFVMLDADIAKSCSTDMFHKAYPERSYNFGIAEQNLMGIAAGFAASGVKAFAATYSVFASMRALEQVRTFISYPKLPVRIIASHGGLQVGPDGATHQAIEDMAIMRAVPNMTIIQPSDGMSAAAAARAVMDVDGPVYIRVLRNPSPVLFESYDFQIGKAVQHKDYGTDATVIATGAMVEKSLAVADQLKAEGINVRVLEFHTLKPFDSEAVIKAAKETGAIVTVEDHNIIGGLGGAVAEVLSEECPTLLKRIGVPDLFGESGPSEELYTEYGMNTPHIIQAVKDVIARKS